MTPRCGYFVFQEVGAIGREPKDGEVFAVLARSEWRNALDH